MVRIDVRCGHAATLEDRGIGSFSNKATEKAKESRSEIVAKFVGQNGTGHKLS